ncbi:MAG TPA: hypothetical protein VMA72_27530 [Streptosporangiaceae bacterium]|nr:hypothetical protein [Streptosporangiaceae bacterium]
MWALGHPDTDIAVLAARALGRNAHLASPVDMSAGNAELASRLAARCMRPMPIAAIPASSPRVSRP